jgi:hypothetical protein
VLVTMRERLSLPLARADANEVLGSLRMVVVDEWHELLGNKRGVQVQLSLARLRRWNAGLCVWGMAATLGNLQDAMRTLLGGDGGLDSSASTSTFSASRRAVRSSMRSGHVVSDCLKRASLAPGRSARGNGAALTTSRRSAAFGAGSPTAAVGHAWHEPAAQAAMRDPRVAPRPPP